MNILELKVRCDRRVWMVCAVISFVLLGRWRILFRGSSLLEGILDLPAALRGPLEIPALIHLTVIVVVYATISTSLGWVIAAMISSILAVLREIIGGEDSARQR